MIPAEIRERPNPYLPTTPKIGSREFVGREDEIRKLQSLLDEYKRTLRLRNVIITGEKSIGKSSLLYRYKQILEGNNFIVYEVELSRESSIEIDEFEFFKDLITELFNKYAPPDGAFFDVEQSEIWFSLTCDKYEHSSDFKKRRIGFPSRYANRKKRVTEKLSYKEMERDFEEILNQLISSEMEIEGLAIVVDEFQELSRNLLIVDV